MSVSKNFNTDIYILKMRLIIILKGVDVSVYSIIAITKTFFSNIYLINKLFEAVTVREPRFGTKGPA